MYQSALNYCRETDRWMETGSGWPARTYINRRDTQFVAIIPAPAPAVVKERIIYIRPPSTGWVVGRRR
jgi:hypothetical protein